MVDERQRETMVEHAHLFDEGYLQDIPTTTSTTNKTVLLRAIIYKNHKIRVIIAQHYRL